LKARLGTQTKRPKEVDHGSYRREGRKQSKRALRGQWELGEKNRKPRMTNLYPPGRARMMGPSVLLKGRSHKHH